MTILQRTIRNSTIRNLFVQDYLLGSRAGTIYCQSHHNSISLGVRYQSTSTNSRTQPSSSPSSTTKPLINSKRSFHPLTPELAKAATQCVAETFATQEDPFTW